MKVIVFAYNRYSDMSTSRALDAEGIDHTVLCYDVASQEKFVAHGTARRERIVVTGGANGLANQRNWCLEHLLGEGEWCLMLVDDWMQAYELEGYDEQDTDLPITIENARFYTKRFKHRISMTRFLHHAEALRRELAMAHVDLGGFAGYDNPLFRGAHWRRNVVVDGRAWVLRKTHLRFDPQAQMIDDVTFSAQNIFYGNGVLVNQWVLPDCKRYTTGGFGTKDQRMKDKLRECAYLVAAYPGVIRYAAKPGWPPGSHVALAHLPPGRVARLRAAAAAVQQVDR